MKKIAPKHIHTVNNFDAENAEIFDDFISNIELILQKFDISRTEYEGRVKIKQNLQVIDTKQVKKNKNKLF